MSKTTEFIDNSGIKQRFYIEFELHLENHTEEEVLQLCNDFVELTKKHKCHPPKAMIRENPTYDSFGNLWE